jgi:1-acyl-sn-glycerol-3-phosphate acyltransferase
MKMIDKILTFLMLSLAKALSYGYFGLKVEGKDHISAENTFIVAANHQSFLDPMIIQVALPFKVRWIAKKAVYNKRLLALAHWLYNSIPVNGSVDKVLDALKKRDTIGIFPEGTRSKDGKIKEAVAGVAIIAHKSGMPVLPIGISGSYEAYRPEWILPRPGKVRVKIGRPFLLRKVQEGVYIEEGELDKSRRLIMDKIRELAEASR